MSTDEGIGLKSVNYLMSGPSHLANLVVSLYSLRRHWKGSVFVHTWEESSDIVNTIKTDRRLKVNEVFRRRPRFRGKNDQFCDKIMMMQRIPTEFGLYLDADTMVCKPIDRIFDILESGRTTFVATQFNDWKSNSGMPKNRIQRLVGRKPINQEAVQTVLNTPFPSANGGVFACHRDSMVLPLWYEWTKAVKDIFIADETVLHVLLAEFDATGQIQVMRGGAWNCSPKYQPKGLDDDLVVIRHYHGDSNVRPDKSRRGFDQWWPVYQQCRKENIGYINDWIDKIDNRHLKKVELEVIHAR